MNEIYCAGYRILRPVSDSKAARSWPDILRALRKLEPGECLPIQSRDRRKLAQIRLEFGCDYRTKLVGDILYLRRASATNSRRRPATLEAIERHAVQHALALADGRIGKAASILGIGRTTLYRKMRKAQTVSVC